MSSMIHFAVKVHRSGEKRVQKSEEGENNFGASLFMRERERDTDRQVGKGTTDDI